MKDDEKDFNMMAIIAEEVIEIIKSNFHIINVLDTHFWPLQVIEKKALLKKITAKSAKNGQ